MTPHVFFRSCRFEPSNDCVCQHSPLLHRPLLVYPSLTYQFTRVEGTSPIQGRAHIQEQQGESKHQKKTRRPNKKKMAINIRAYSRDSDTGAGVGNAIIQQHHAPPGFLLFYFFFFFFFIIILSHIIFLLLIYHVYSMYRELR